MPSLSELQGAAQTAPQQTESLHLSWGGGGGVYIEKPEIRAKWAALIQALGGQEGAEVDLRVVWKKFLTDRKVYRYNPDTQQREQKYPNAKGTKGCGLLFEVREAGFEGLTFYADGAQSLFATTPLAKVISAVARRKFQERDSVNPFDYVGQELILTVALGPEVRVKEDGSHVNSGGRYWKIRSYRQLPVRLSVSSPTPPVAPPAPAPAPVLDDEDDLDGVPF